MKTKHLIPIVVTVILVIMLWNAFTQKGINDLETNFKEVATYRNENNTGPVRRVYVVTVSDTAWADLEAYGNFQPYTKLGTTEVFFFMEGREYPTELNSSPPYFSQAFNSGVVAKYEKNPSGLVSLKKFPFR